MIDNKDKNHLSLNVTIKNELNTLYSEMKSLQNNIESLIKKYQ